jgi:acyl-coenzyme A synthetase/AMP-(fatty) acid ligase
LNRGANCNAEALTHFCKESLAPYKAPKTVEFVSILPRTGLGKIDRGKLESVTRQD